MRYLCASRWWSSLRCRLLRRRGYCLRCVALSLWFPRILFTSIPYLVETSPSSLSNTLRTQLLFSSTRLARSQKETSRLSNSTPSPTTPLHWYITSRKPVLTQLPKPSPITFAPSSPPLQLPRSWERSLPSLDKVSKLNSVGGHYGVGTVGG